MSITKYKINDSVWFDYSTPFDLTGLNFGTYAISYYSIDNAGNVEEIQTIDITLIGSDPQNSSNSVPSFMVFPIISILVFYVLINNRKIKRKKLEKI